MGGGGTSRTSGAIGRWGVDAGARSVFGAAGAKRLSTSSGALRLSGGNTSKVDDGAIGATSSAGRVMSVAGLARWMAQPAAVPSRVSRRHPQVAALAQWAQPAQPAQPMQQAQRARVRQGPQAVGAAHSRHQSVAATLRPAHSFPRPARAGSPIRVRRRGGAT
jgi:hypothetical protein